MRGRTPKRKLSKEQQEAADAFIDAAEEKPEADASSKADEASEPYPWEAPHVRDDVTKTYLLRMTEPLHLKLKYLSEKTGKSMNQICTEAVEEEVLEALEEMEDRQ